jgi:hypothetical protein
VGEEGRAGPGGTPGGTETPGGPAASSGNAPVIAAAELSAASVFPDQTPLFFAEQADRYERQRLIREYERLFDCRFVVMIDAIFADSITYFEELIHDADPNEDLHLLLSSPGGDGETAVRLVRSAQSRCRALTVIVPDQAKSAATILAMGAHRILMGPTSDLGPVDPQFLLGRDPDRQLVSAKDLIAAVEQAERAVAANPDSYPLHAAMLADVTEVMVQQARSALERTEDLVAEALKSNPDRTAEEVAALEQSLKAPLISLAKNHGAIFGSADALAAGLPVTEADPSSVQWRLIWLLWAKYFILAPRVYEGRRASRVIGPERF